MGVKKFGMASSSNIRKGKELRWNEKRTEQKSLRSKRFCVKPIVEKIIMFGN